MKLTLVGASVLSRVGARGLRLVGASRRFISCHFMPIGTSQILRSQATRTSRSRQFAPENQHRRTDSRQRNRTDKRKRDRTDTRQNDRTD